ncbi:hypothetical protein PFISCL1PPCAC_4546, partial [Pristionchus fissidentatus]
AQCLTTAAKSEQMDLIVGCSVGGSILLIIIIVVICVCVRRNRHGDWKDNDGTSRGETGGGTPKQSDRVTPSTTPKTKTPSTDKGTTRRSQSQTEFENKLENNGAKSRTSGTGTGGDKGYENVEINNGARASPAKDANKNRAVPILNPFGG